MYRSANPSTLAQSKKCVPSIFKNCIQAPFRDDVLSRARKAFRKYESRETAAGRDSGIPLHQLMNDPDFKSIVLDHVALFCKSEAFDVATGLLGNSVAFQLSVSHAFLRFPGTAAALPPLVQNAALTGNDFPILSFWIPLNDCGKDAPSLQFIDTHLEEDLSSLLRTEMSDYERSSAEGRADYEAFLHKRYGGPLRTLRMAAGDCAMFDQFTLHRPYATPAMTRPCCSLALHAFPADKMLQDPDRWMQDRADAEILIASKGKQGVYLSHKSLARIVNPQRGIFQFVRGDHETQAERDAREQRLAGLVAEAERSKPSFRVPEALAAFLERTPSSAGPAVDGRCYVYPLGVDARALFPVLERLPQTEILGFVDRQGGALPPFHGHEGVSPQDLAGRPFDRVLVVHNSRARVEELTAQLRAAGVAEDRIIDLFDLPGFADFSVDWKLDQLEATLDKDKVDYVLLRAPAGYILGQATIAALLPPERTLIVQMDEPAEAAAIPGYKAIAIQSCLRALPKLLQRVNPRVVFTQGWADTYFWSYLIKTSVPNATMIVEMYDLWLAMAEYPVARFAAFCGIPEPRLNMYRLGEEYAFQHADLIVSKRFGEEWRKTVLHDDGAAYASYFPHIEGELIALGQAAGQSGAPAKEQPAAQTLSIVDATSLAPAARLRQEPDVLVSYSPFTLMEQLAATEPVRFDVFNGFHRRTDEDASFAEYMSRYERGAIRYHRGLPLAELIPRLSGFDYGWLNFPIPFDHPDPPFVALNRMTTYALAGLPIIATKRLKFTAELIQRFNAGLVVEEATVEETRAALRRADPVAHRAGILALRNFMLAENRRVLESIRQYLK